MCFCYSFCCVCACVRTWVPVLLFLQLLPVFLHILLQIHSKLCCVLVIYLFVRLLIWWGARNNFVYFHFHCKQNNLPTSSDWLFLTKNSAIYFQTFLRDSNSEVFTSLPFNKDKWNGWARMVKVWDREEVSFWRLKSHIKT